MFSNNAISAKTNVQNIKKVSHVMYISTTSLTELRKAKDFRLPQKEEATAPQWISLRAFVDNILSHICINVKQKVYSVPL